MISRATCERAFRAAIVACDPGQRVAFSLAPLLRGQKRIGLAIGKSALAMARGAGAVARGLAIAPFDDGRPLPAGWAALLGSYPDADVEAGIAAIDLVASVRAGDTILALLSGGAAALAEQPVRGVTIDRLRAEIRALIASGATAAEVHARRCELSAIAGGKLAAMADARIVTLAASDVYDDELAVIGGGPTITDPPRAGDSAHVIAAMRTFAERSSIEVARVVGRYIEVARAAVTGDVASVADELARASTAPIAWGKPTVCVCADHGEGGRAQHLALELARRLRGTDRSAFVAASDGIDGSPPRDRPAAAGAFVDGTTWDAIRAARIDPAAALARCDAGTALAAVGALVITGPTGIDHGVVMIVG